MATAAATSSFLLCKTLSQPKSLQGRAIVCSFPYPSKPFSLVEPLAVLASSCSISPLVRKARPFDLGFVTRVVMSDLDMEQDEEGEEEEDGFGSEDSYEEESDEEVAVKDEFDGNSKLFVGNLPFSVDSAQLAGVFGEAGTVEMVEVIYDKVTGRSRGFGFVTMGTAQEAATAVDRLDGFVLEGREIRVRSGPPPPKDESAPLRGFRGGAQGDGYRGGSQGDEHRVHVGNLSWGVDNSTLKTLFSEQGKVIEAKVIYDRETGRSRGFGFVTYGSADEVDNAIASLDGADLDGRSIKVSMAEARPPRRQNFF
ncbi:ribonucleoprotein A [Carex littledalei]|uniref:Ribonucleoprotein A n=1 Tax=Carex littledalei TaxID=544730 RepID=A0A833QQF2_9POAL|nr:ribonucleoprotein A [Carex littledalei]